MPREGVGVVAGQDAQGLAVLFEANLLTAHGIERERMSQVVLELEFARPGAGPLPVLAARQGDARESDPAQLLGEAAAASLPGTEFRLTYTLGEPKNGVT